MFIFKYATDWAQLVTGQIALAHGSDVVDDWAYACLSISRRFDLAIERNYEEVNATLGRAIHVFTLLPPPRGFLEERIAALSSQTTYAADRVREELIRIMSDEQAYDPRFSHQRVSEKTSLLEGLSDAGLSPGKYPDFLFFKFRAGTGDGAEIQVDVIAARCAPLTEEDPDWKYIEFFAEMGAKAREHRQKKSSVEEFVRSLTWTWAVPVFLKRSASLLQFVGLLSGEKTA